MAVSDYDSATGGAPVWRKKLSITVSSAGTNAEEDKDINGRLTEIMFVVPDLDDTDTAELKLQDEDDETWFASGELAESTNHHILLTRDLVGTTTFRIECSGPQASERTFAIYLKGIR